MYRELTNSLTMKILALGRPHYEAERIAAVIIVWVVLLCTMMGCTIAIEGVPLQVRNEWLRPGGTRSQDIIVAGTCGILSVRTGTTGIQARALLHR